MDLETNTKWISRKSRSAIDFLMNDELVAAAHDPELKAEVVDRLQTHRHYASQWRLLSDERDKHQRMVDDMINNLERAEEWLKEKNARAKTAEDKMMAAHAAVKAVRIKVGEESASRKRKAEGEVKEEVNKKVKAEVKAEVLEEVQEESVDEVEEIDDSPELPLQDTQAEIVKASV